MTTERRAPFAISERLYNFYIRNKGKILYEDTMIIGILWGDVGSGKSVKAQECVGIVSPEKITLEKIAFTKDELIKAVLMSRQEAIIADEGIAIFFSRGAMTKEGRLMAELMGQCRQKNLLLLICIPDILSVDSMILGMAKFVGHVWESRKMVNGRMVTIKGNMRLYQHFRSNSFKDKIIQYLRVKKSNPRLKLKKPKPYLTEAGAPYGEGFKGAYYCVDEAAYKAKKEGVLNKYRKQLERKPRNTSVDFATMDKLIKAKVPLKRIAEMLNASYTLVKKRKARVYTRGIKKR